VRVIFDENLSPALARALNALFAGEHEVAHIRDKFGPKVDDADWISALSAEGRWVVVSGDAKIARRKSEQAAFRNSRLIGFFFAPALSRSKVTKQMQRLLALWDRRRNHRRSRGWRSDVRASDIGKNPAAEDVDVGLRGRT
jgi:PIN like domain